MSTHPAPRPSAAQAAAIRSGAGRRSTVSVLTRLSDRLDQLLRDVSLGATSHREVERQIGEAEAIATALRGAFREPVAARPVHPPIYHKGGKAAWW